MIFFKPRIAVDFFAGSGTTAHAIMKSNFEDQGNRRFLLIQLKEPIDTKLPSGINAKELGLNAISEISKERIIRAGRQLSSVFREKGKDMNLDIHYKSYKLDRSSFKKWKNYNGTDTKQLETLFSQHESSLVDDWKPENLLTEILLIEGFPLDSKIETVEAFKKNKVQKVTSDFCEHTLFVCLDQKVEDETIKALSLGDNDIFICLDNAVTDQDKVRLDDKGLIKTI